ncbi:thiamine pyrophosphate-binding protein [Xenorhabdus griffiniae]|uniref:thiamine pyrophosphate-binding protein n=1 Tax=Xenorhabdus griffiniae TaxID=351672 RepID=UPI0023596655|nr:thiamine pyrophosphate-binding protein [Xenorhabdus griffiniae]MDC9604136.1 thiamine pyrophosphate-binding protein [Xenorhabdus griffiniae]
MEMHNVLQDSTQSGINQQAIFSPVTRATFEVKAGQSISRFLRESFRAMKGIERGPVYLGVSKEILNEYDENRPDISSSISDSWKDRPVDINKIRSPEFKNFMSKTHNCIILAGLDITCGITANSSAFLKALDEHYPNIIIQSRFKREKWLQYLSIIPKYFPIDFSATGDATRHPASYINILQKHFPENGIVSVDSGEYRSFFGHHWIVRRPETQM